MTQGERIIQMLRSAGDLGVTNAEFAMEGILKYTSRISDLRAAGYVIDCKTNPHPNRPHTNVYILVAMPTKYDKDGQGKLL